MPTYSYACADCGHRFDIYQSFSEDSLTVCPECEGKLRKVFNSVGVVFKGSGFYRTDSRAAAAKSGGDKGGGDSSGSSKSGGDKPSSSKPAPAASTSGGSDS